MRVPLRRAGPDRPFVEYRELYAHAKGRLLRTINAERAARGARPLAYDLVGARAGDEFCREAAMRGYTGHWDLSGRPPYLRYADAGGLDYHAQNVAGRSQRGAPLTEGVEELLHEAHRMMMDERPPHDAHRRTVLDPAFTHVGIGAAVVGGEFRMTEEYSRQVAEWIEVPAEPVPPRARAPFAAKLPAGWNVGAVEVAFEPPPRPMSVREIERRRVYEYPRAIRTFRPLLPAGQMWRDGSRGDFSIVSGRLALDVPLENGPGHYIVLVYAGQGSISGRPLSPVVAARIEAR